MSPDAKRLGWSVAALVVAAGVCFGLLHLHHPAQSSGTYLCRVCGCKARLTYLDHELASNQPIEDDHVFSQRFGRWIPEGHPHEWAPLGCIATDRGYALVWSCGPCWIEMLPRLSDSAASEALFREAMGMAREQRTQLIEEFEGAVCVPPPDRDAAFARWNANRLRQGSAPANPAPR